MQEQILLTNRDNKVRPVLEDFAPAWLIDQKFIPEDEAVQFTVVFQHPQYGWVSRRYKFDGFNDVLYYKGQLILTEEQALKVQESGEPFVAATVSDIVNSYGG